MKPVDTLQGVDTTQLIAKTRRIIDAIGLPATLALLQARGGTILELPHGRLYRQRRSMLVGLIGEAAAEAFLGAFANGERRMFLPKADKILLQVRNRAIRADDEHSNTELALAYKLTVRQIQTIRNTETPPQKPTRQGDLFSPAPENARQGV